MHDREKLADGPDVVRAAAPNTIEIVALRQWIGDKRENELILYETLHDKMRFYTRQEAEMVLELLHSFSPEARQDTETYVKLILNLTHRKLAIRHLSHWHLVGLYPEGRSIPYSHTADKDTLANGQREWKKRIPEGGLPPKPKAPPPNRRTPATET